MNLSERILSRNKNIAVIDGSTRYSHDHLRKHVLQIASGLHKDFSIKPGDKIVLIAHNSMEFLISYLAILAMGAVVVPLDPYLNEAEMARDIAQVKPVLIISFSSEVIPQTYLKDIACIEFHSQQWRSYQKNKLMDIVQRDPNDVAVMMMTAGTFFQPRPAMLTHKSLITNIEQASALDELGLKETDVVLSVLPMYHIFGLHVVAGFTLAQNATLVIAQSFDAIELSTIIRSEKITVIPGVPSLFEMFTNKVQVTIDTFSNVRLVISGGAPMRETSRNKFHERFGTTIAQGYGLTEASPMVSFALDVKREGDIGQALPGVQIDVRDNTTGDSALVGDAGEIVVRGDNVFIGYYGEREASSKVLDVNGWLYTGDIGVKQEDGTITLIDRSSDVIVVHGFSVYPSEVESILEEVPYIIRAHVVGELNERSGESVIAHIALEDSSALQDPKGLRQIEKELIDLCHSKLARYKIPTRFEFGDQSNLNIGSRQLRKSLRSALRNLD